MTPQELIIEMNRIEEELLIYVDDLQTKLRKLKYKFGALSHVFTNNYYLKLEDATSLAIHETWDDDWCASVPTSWLGLSKEELMLKIKEEEKEKEERIREYHAAIAKKREEEELAQLKRLKEKYE